VSLCYKSEWDKKGMLMKSADIRTPLGFRRKDGVEKDVADEGLRRMREEAKTTSGWDSELILLRPNS
jgi:hypothetical protein